MLRQASQGAGLLAPNPAVATRLLQTAVSADNMASSPHKDSSEWAAFARYGFAIGNI